MGGACRLRPSIGRGSMSRREPRRPAQRGAPLEKRRLTTVQCRDSINASYNEVLATRSRRSATIVQ